MTFEERIRSGLDGKYEGLSNGLDRINNYIFGLQRSCYMLIGGGSGSGKTTLVDFMLISAIQDAISKNIPINIFYYSYEIDEFTKRANWLSVLIYNRYNIIITPEKIKGLGKYRLNSEEQTLVNNTIPELNDIFSKIHWRWESLNPTGMYKEWWNFMEKRGTFTTEPYLDENNVKKERIIKFTNNNPEEYTVAVIDHIAQKGALASNGY